MKINKQNKNGKEVSIVYGEDNSISVNIFNNKILMEIVGSFDNNLKELEKITKTSIYSRGNSILIKSSQNKNEIVKKAIQFFSRAQEITSYKTCEWGYWLYDFTFTCFEGYREIWYEFKPLHDNRR